MTENVSFSLVLHSGEYERVHYGLVMASAAVAIGRQVTILFAGDAVRYIHKNTQLPLTDARRQALNIAGFEELLNASHELGARFIVCETALVLAEMSSDDLRSDIGLETGGFVTYLNAIGKGGQSLFV